MLYELPQPRALTGITSHLEGEIRKKVGVISNARANAASNQRMTQLLEQIIQMTQKTLGAEAASILLFRDNNYELYFEAASGPVSRVLKHVKIDTRYGIAGQVARTGKPLIVNDVSRSESFHKSIDDTTGFSTRSLICAPLKSRYYILGVIEIINKLDGSDFEEKDLDAALSVVNTAALAIENTRLQQITSDAYRNTVSALATAVDTKVPYTCGHSQRVMEYALIAGTSLTLSRDDMETLQYGAILHDIGKIIIDARILKKPGELTSEEWEIIREHPASGAEILKEVPFLEKARELVLYHHERYDGKGYPAGLKGEDIPLGARLIAVANAFDTIITDRSYRDASSIEHAIRELRNCSGTQFCPVAVDAFVSGLKSGNYFLASGDESI